MFFAAPSLKRIGDVEEEPDLRIFPSQWRVTILNCNPLTMGSDFIDGCHTHPAKTERGVAHCSPTP